MLDSGAWHGLNPPIIIVYALFHDLPFCCACALKANFSFFSMHSHYQAFFYLQLTSGVKSRCSTVAPSLILPHSLESTLGFQGSGLFSYSAMLLSILSFFWHWRVLISWIAGILEISGFQEFIPKIMFCSIFDL